MQTTDDAPMIPTTDFPKLLAALRNLGDTHAERQAALGVGSTKYVERIMRRLPVPMKPFVSGPSAPILLRALLADIEQKTA